MSSRHHRRWRGRCLALAALVAAGLAVVGAVASGPLVTFDDHRAAEPSGLGLSVHVP